MKTRFLILCALILTVMATPLVAQDCKICGDWIGTCSLDHEWDPVYKTMTKKTYKIYVRIKQEEQNHFVRVKLVPLDGGETWYQEPCNIKYITSNSITWSVFLRDDSNWDDSDKYNGLTIGYAKYYHYYKVVSCDGYLCLTCQVIVQYYSRSGSFIGTDKGPFHIRTNIYKDDDW